MPLCTFHRAVHQAGDTPMLFTHRHRDHWSARFKVCLPQVYIVCEHNTIYVPLTDYPDLGIRLLVRFPAVWARFYCWRVSYGTHTKTWVSTRSVRATMYCEETVSGKGKWLSLDESYTQDAAPTIIGRAVHRGHRHIFIGTRWYLK